MTPRQSSVGRLFLGILWLCCVSLGWSTYAAGEPVLALLHYARNPDAVLGKVTLERLQAMERPSKGAARWAVDTFLRGEIHWMREEADQAREAYRSLVDWSRSDEKGGSGLAGIALWRLLYDPRIADDKDYAQYLIEVADAILSKPTVNRFFARPRPRVRVGFSRFKEDIVRQLISIAFGIGDREKALSLFLGSVALRTSAQLTPLEVSLLEQALESGSLTRGEFALHLGGHLKDIGHFREAGVHLRAARKHGETSQIRARAGLLLAQIWRAANQQRSKIIELLDSVIEGLDHDVDAATTQNAYFMRAIRHRREGDGQNIDLAIRDLKTIIDKFPKGERTDNAIYELARTFELKNDTVNALRYYKILQQFEPERNDRIDSAYFRPALSQYGTGKPSAITEAVQLFNILKHGREGTSGALFRHSLFWLARTHEEQGNIQQARAYFRQVTQDKANLFDYYAIRSLMHLNMGIQAAGAIFPDDRTVAVLRANLRRASDHLANHAISIDSKYLKRVQWAFQSGVYIKALEGGVRELLRRESFPRQWSDPFYLDETGVLPSLVVHTALLHDALTAVRSISGADRTIVANWFSMAGDWTSGLTVLGYWGADRNAAGWLAAAFPAAFLEQIRGTGARHDVSPELLYAIMKHESWFSPIANSTSGALGLFQFMPTTFVTLDRRWDLLKEPGGPGTMEGFLSNPDSNIELGGRWFRGLLDRHEGAGKSRQLLAMIEHNAGPEAVDRWKEYWQRIGRQEDVEYMVETSRYLQTRFLLRETLVGIAVAMVLFDD